MRQDIFEAADAPDEPREGAPASADAEQVSAVANLGDGDPIEPDQATAAHPSGDVQEGTAGPNARPRHNQPGMAPGDLD